MPSMPDDLGAMFRRHYDGQEFNDDQRCSIALVRENQSRLANEQGDNPWPHPRKSYDGGSARMGCFLTSGPLETEAAEIPAEEMPADDWVGDGVALRTA